MSLVFTMPGKIGDALHQWPVVFWYCRQNNMKCVLWLDENTLKPLVNLFEAQPCVERCELKPGITSWHMGGQPWDFGLQISDHMDHEIYHLGMRNFPSRQITLETLERVPLKIEKPEHSKTLVIPPTERHGRRIVVHGTFLSHQSGTPGVWKFFHDVYPELRELADEIVFVGSAGERKRVAELYPDCKTFDDQGDFLKLAQFMTDSILVIGAGSSNVVLASLLGIPTIRVHDPIGEFPKVIWSNLGENQLNELPRDLRVLWPEFRDKWLGVPTP